jgi:uncharacterized protein YdbL (DUF1318 family)
MRTLTQAATLLVLTSACVTVNVNFPESAVQRATDDYVQELYRAKNKDKAPTSAPAKSPTSLLDLLIPSALALEFDATFRTDTAAAKEIQARQATRLEEIDAQKKAGALGESSDGTLVIKSPDKLKKLLTKKVEKLVEDENVDRKKLYEEVQEANKLPSSRIKDVGASFGRSFQKASPAGTWVQDEKSGWKQK